MLVKERRIEWLTFLLPIRAVQGSNLGTETGYRYYCFRFILGPPGECRDRNLKSDDDSFLPHPFQFIIHPSFLHSTIYSVSY
jgi:hypothetical protein